MIPPFIASRFRVFSIVYVVAPGLTGRGGASNGAEFQL